MSQRRVLPPSNATIEALCHPGPLLDSFDIDLPLVRSTPVGRTALAFLSEVAGTSDDSSCLSQELMALAEIVQEELLELDMDDLAQWLSGLNVAQHGRTDGHILFTSNVLLTSPDASDEHRWHFDHPMTIGADVAANEIVHGLKGLDAAIAFEKERGTLDVTAVVDCVLSVSVTHESLVPLARDEVRRSIVAAGELEHLAVFAFTEADTRRLVTEVLAPAIGCDPSLLTVFGVNGNYGRHYSFCKAIAALWQAVVDPDIDRTFKFDLDQVFPQEHLVAETGKSALELLTTGSQWGARGVDSRGRQVNLGMCAGALVNPSDIDRGLFTPDIECPMSPPSLPDLIFRKAVPQALSTEA
jgi:hypothetical protein